MEDGNAEDRQRGYYRFRRRKDDPVDGGNNRLTGRACEGLVYRGCGVGSEEIGHVGFSEGPVRTVKRSSNIARKKPSRAKM
jgi:hypothetical protein